MKYSFRAFVTAILFGLGLSLSAIPALAATNQPSIWTWLDPNQTWINRNQTVMYYAGAWSANGLQHIDLYANGSLRRSCSFSLAYGNQQCSVTLYGNDYPAYQNVSLTAQATDASGKTVWSNTQTIQATDAYSSTSGSGASSAYDLSAWGTLDPSGTTLNRNSSVVYHAQASASQGLSRVDVYANDSIVRTCSFSNQTGTQSCDATIYGYNYATNAQVSIRALATDAYGRTAWSDTRSVMVQDTTTNSSTYYSGSTSNANASSWVWSVPEQTSLAKNASAVFNVGAWDPDGIQRIDIYANGALANSCALNNAYGNQNCSATIYAGSYSAGTTVTVNARITDRYGNAFWSDSRPYTIPAYVVTTSANVTPSTMYATTFRRGYGYGFWQKGRWSRVGAASTNGTIRVVSDHEGGYANGETITITATADGATNVQNINILIDAQLVKTCSNQTVCTVTSVAYGRGRTMTYAATLTNARGNVSATEYQVLKKR